MSLGPAGREGASESWAGGQGLPDLETLDLDPQGLPHPVPGELTSTQDHLSSTQGAEPMLKLQTLPPASSPDPVCSPTPPRDPGVRAEPVVLFCPSTLWGATEGGGDPPAVCGPVGPALHPLLLQPGRAFHLPASRYPQTAPSTHWSLCHLPVSWGWGWGTEEVVVLKGPGHLNVWRARGVLDSESAQMCTLES